MIRWNPFLPFTILALFLIYVDLLNGDALHASILMLAMILGNLMRTRSFEDMAYPFVALWVGYNFAIGQFLGAFYVCIWVLTVIGISRLQQTTKGQQLVRRLWLKFADHEFGKEMFVRYDPEHGYRAGLLLHASLATVPVFIALFIAQPILGLQP